MKTTKCISCDSSDKVIKSGRTSAGIQRYKCKACNATFVVDQSPTKYLKISDYKFKKFIGLMIDDVTLEVISRNLDINIKTAHYYRYIIFKVLENYQESIRLDGKVLIDETFIPINELSYKAFKPDGSNFRGISRNQLCILTIVSLFGKCVIKISSRGMALRDEYLTYLNKNVGKVKLFIHDGCTHQVKFMKQYDCERINWKRTDSDEINGALVDALHSGIKRYFFKHSGFRLRYSQHYLNFYTFRWNNLSRIDFKNKNKVKKAKNELVDKLFKLVKKSKQKITYRSFLEDEGISEILKLDV